MIDKEFLLDDAQMQQFIVDGYITVRADYPPTFHEKTYQQLEAVFEHEGNIGNNIRHVSNFSKNKLTLCLDGRMEGWKDGKDNPPLFHPSTLPIFHPSHHPKCKQFSETCPLYAKIPIRTNARTSNSFLEPQKSLVEWGRS